MLKSKQINQNGYSDQKDQVNGYPKCSNEFKDQFSSQSIRNLTEGKNTNKNTPISVYKKVVIRSGSKINLYLNVSKDLRPDGYHEIKSIMQSISLSDELEFLVTPIYEPAIIDSKYNEAYDEVNDEANDEVNDEVKICKDNKNNGIIIICNNGDIPLNEKNLVHKAALILLKKFNLENKYKITIKIKKSIPVSSGLAGGSSNAAATLIALNKIFGLGISLDELIIIGNEVGSDVPFCISGGTALVEGKGEKIKKLTDMPFYWIVIAINGRKFSSGDVYEKFDLIGSEKKSSHEVLIKSLKNKNFKKFFSNIFNHLESVVTTEDKMVSILKNKAL